MTIGWHGTSARPAILTDEEADCVRTHEYGEAIGAIEGDDVAGERVVSLSVFVQRFVLEHMSDIMDDLEPSVDQLLDMFEWRRERGLPPFPGQHIIEDLPRDVGQYLSDSDDSLATQGGDTPFEEELDHYFDFTAWSNASHVGVNFEDD